MLCYTRCVTQDSSTVPRRKVGRFVLGSTEQLNLHISDEFHDHRWCSTFAFVAFHTWKLARGKCSVTNKQPPYRLDDTTLWKITCCRGYFSWNFYWTNEFSLDYTNFCYLKIYINFPCAFLLVWMACGRLIKISRHLGYLKIDFCVLLVEVTRYYLDYNLIFERQITITARSYKRYVDLC